MTLVRFYKPYGVLSQFRDPARPTLAAFIDLPGVYPAGRLDQDSEGLMLLTDHGALQARIADPRFELPKLYWAQVEARPDPAELAELARRLQAGVKLKDGLARAWSLAPLNEPDLPPRNPPVTAHRAARGSWLAVVLTSGRNRQVRRMLAAVGLPVLRLHRASIGPVDLEGLAPGDWEIIPTPQILWGGPAARSGRRAVRPSGRGRSSR